MDLYIKSILGKIEMVTHHSVSRKNSEDGKKEISVSIVKTEHNNHAYSLVINENIFIYDNEEYVIKKHSESTKKGTTLVNCTAIHRSIEDFRHNYIYDTITGSFKIDKLIEFVTTGTGYTFIIEMDGIDHSITIENFGDGDSQSLFKSVIDKFSAEYEVIGNTIYVKKEIGKKTDNQFRYLLNISNPQKDIDTTNLKTFIKGFGAKNEDGTYIAQVEYTSPLASIYGIRHANPVRDERFKDNTSLILECQKNLTDSLEMSIKMTSTEIESLKWEKVNRGDYVWCILDPFDLYVYIRVAEVEDFSDPNKDSIYTLGTVKKNAKAIIAGLNKTKKTVDRIAIDNKVKSSAIIINSETNFAQGYNPATKLETADLEEINNIVSLLQDSISKKADNVLANSFTNGLLSSTLFKKLISINVDENGNVSVDLSNFEEELNSLEQQLNSKAGTTVVTTSENGLMAFQDKIKLNQILTDSGQVYDLSIIMQKISEIEGKLTEIENKITALESDEGGSI